MEDDRGSNIARKCWKEMKEKIMRRRGGSRYEKKRVRFFKDMEVQEIEK